jgi:alpha-mannosidase
VKLTPGKPQQATAQVSGKTAGQSIVLENAELRVTINRDGQISGLFDKTANRQLVARGRAMNRLEMYRDNASDCDAWDLDISYKSCPVDLPPARSVKLVAAGPLEAAVEATHRFGRSVLVQRIVLRANSRRVEFITQADWHEQHRVLKAAFEADLSVPMLRGEIQFGHVVRPTHRNNEFERQRFEWPAQKWADLSEAHYGVAVLNDCKYGYDILDGVLRLTLLTAKMFPDETADRGKHEFTYALYAHDGGFADAETVREAMELNVPPTVARAAGSAGEKGFLELSNPDVIVETIKRSEDGKSLVVRLYESLGASAATSLRVAGDHAKAQECNLIEEPRRDLPIRRDGWVSLDFRPFEIKTVRLT